MTLPFRSLARYLNILMLFCMALPLLAQGEKKFVPSGKPAGQGTERRLALIIGNTEYKGNPLKNPVNDANLMAKTLEGCGFTVTLLLNQDYIQMNKALATFTKQLVNAEAGVFFYAGHGVQSMGINYLLPTDIEPQNEEELSHVAINAQDALKDMSGANCKFSIVILDACRDNPFVLRATKDLSQGLKKFDQVQSMLIAFSTSEWQTAKDNPDGKNSFYTEELTKQMRVPGQRLEDVFNETAKAVQEKTGQRPWYNSGLTDKFFFIKGDANAKPVNPTSQPIKPQSNIIEEGNPAFLTLMTDPPGARIILDGKDTGKKTPSTLSIEFEEPTKEVKVLLLLKGYVAKRLRVTLEPGQKLTSDLYSLVTASADYVAPVVPTVPVKATDPNPSTPTRTGTKIKTTPKWSGQTPTVNQKPEVIALTIDKTKLERIPIPAGKFFMGTSSGAALEGPRHEVELADFSISKTPITVGMYKRFCQASKGKHEMPKAPEFNPNWANETHPMVNITYREALAFCNSLGGDLPTEAEWEKAARGTDGRAYTWGNEFNERKLWFNKEESKGTCGVNLFTDSPYGVSDMAGNVAQWCKDWFVPDFYSQLEASYANPQGPKEGADGMRSIRGCGWNLKDANFARVTVRGGVNPDEAQNWVGFRVVWRK